MNFGTPDQILSTIRAGDEVEEVRGQNRNRVISLFNGDPPLTAHEADTMGLRVNVDFGEAVVLGAHARRQYDNATLGTQNFFRATIFNAPAKNKNKWSHFITQKINRVMKASEVYAANQEYQAASILGAGIGPCIWRDNYHWCNKFVKVCDLRIPTDTKTSFEDLPWFAERHAYTPGSFAKKVFGKNSVKGWNKKVAKKILHAYHDINYEQTEYTWDTAPEKMAELYRQNGGFYTSDAVPTISMWHFFFKDEEADPMNPVWKMRVLPDYGEQGVQGVEENVFIYTSDKPVASKVSEMLHVQFGDFNSDPPFMYHSVRSLGFLLVEPCFWTNLTRCRQLQHLHESMNILFRVTDPAGRARAQKIQLFDRAILEEGVSIVPAAERHEVDANLIAQVLSELKQLQNEVGTTYTQNLDTGTKKEQTAFETHARLSAVNAMMGALLSRWGRKKVFELKEICRRFCLRDSRDPDAIRFQKECREQGIPLEFIDADQWDIEVEMPIGAGNPTMAMAQAQQMLAVRPMHDSSAQQEILHMYDEAVLGDSRMAERLVPLDKERDVTDSMRDAEFAFATMMHGVPVRMKEGLSVTDQIDTFMGLMSGVIARIEKQTNLATPSELAGLQTVGQFTANLIQTLSQNEQEKQRVKQYSNVLGKLMNAVKGFAQRAQEKDQAGNGEFDPEIKAKIAGKMIEAQSSAKIKESKATQQQKHKDIAFQKEQQRRDATTFGDIEREKLKTLADARTNRYAKLFENPDML